MPSERRKPAASAWSAPGVRMVMATVSPATRISSGSSTATTSARAGPGAPGVTRRYGRSTVPRFRTSGTLPPAAGPVRAAGVVQRVAHPLEAQRRGQPERRVVEPHQPVQVHALAVAPGAVAEHAAQRCARGVLGGVDDPEGCGRPGQARPSRRASDAAPPAPGPRLRRWGASRDSVRAASLLSRESAALVPVKSTSSTQPAHPYRANFRASCRPDAIVVLLPAASCGRASAPAIHRPLARLERGRSAWHARVHGTDSCSPACSVYSLTASAHDEKGACEDEDTPAAAAGLRSGVPEAWRRAGPG